jgi:MFS family permease
MGALDSLPRFNAFVEGSAHDSASTPQPAATARWYVLILLATIYALNIADRFVISTLIEPIKVELHLSDSAVGFLTGVALALTFVTVGVPLAVLADRVNRRNLIALSLGVWSLMTAVCGLTRTFWQLALARILVGVGAAGSTPPSQSLVSDYFPWRQRAIALSVYSVGASIGSMLGSSAGYMSEQWGWRSAFLVLGIPGVALAVMLRATVQEPGRGRLDSHSLADDAPNFAAVLKFMLGQPALLHVLAGATLFTLWAWGLLWWTPSYLVRSHHLSLREAGGALSLMHGLGGTAVLLATSLLMSGLAGRDPRAVPRFLAFACALGVLPSFFAFAAESRGIALAMLWIFIPMSYALFGPAFALIQNLVPASMRSQAVAVLFLLANVANLVIVPLAVGMVSDLLAPRYGPESLRIALLPLTLFGPWAAVHFWMCSRRLDVGLARAGTAAAQSGMANLENLRTRSAEL